MKEQEIWSQGTLLEEDLPSHKPVEEEYSLYHAVKAGDIDYVKQDCARGGFSNPDGMGKLSRNPLTNIKYHFVVAAALISRHCIDGGMNMEQAFQLSDYYILKLDFCDAISKVVSLHTQMCLNYTGQMRLLNQENTFSKPIQVSLQYIYAHINEKIDLEVLAETTGFSKSYLSRLFRQEVGISLTDYIHMQKIEKAQNLLKYSDYSYIEISNILNFSSQSHFIDIFKKHTGMTPKKYLDTHYRRMW